MIVINSVGEKQIVVQMGETIKEITDQMMELYYENNGYNNVKTAKALGICYRTLTKWKTKNRKIVNQGKYANGTE